MRIVAAIDETEAGKHILEVIGGWASSAAVGVDLLCVVDPDKVHETVSSLNPRHEMAPRGTWAGTQIPVGDAPVVLAEDRTQAMERARSVVSDALEQLANENLSGTDHTVHVAFAGDRAGTICDYAVDRGASVIAIGSRGRSHLRTALFGSVAEAVIRESSVPVLVIRKDMPVPGID